VEFSETQVCRFVVTDIAHTTVSVRTDKKRLLTIDSDFQFYLKLNIIIIICGLIKRGTPALGRAHRASQSYNAV